MTLLSTFRRLTRVLRREDGTAPVEVVFIAPLLIWWLLAAVQYFDAFREKNANQKAAFTISDLISRETSEIDTAYIDRMEGVFDYLTLSRGESWIRVTSVYYDADDGVYRQVWSQATGGHKPHTDESIANEAERIPVLPEGDTIIVVETSTDYRPFFRIGLPALPLNNFVTIRPRYASQVVFEGKEIIFAAAAGAGAI